MPACSFVARRLSLSHVVKSPKLGVHYGQMPHHKTDLRARVLEEFLECGRIDQACKAAGVSRQTHYRWLDEDPEYKAFVDQGVEKLLRQQAGELERLDGR